MHGNEVLIPGLGLQEPWEITGQTLETDKQLHILRFMVKADRGVEFPCPVWGRLCKAHDFKTMTWRRHLNFFQHHCYITASVPRVRCPEHDVKHIKVPWARKSSHFTLLFEQFSMVLVRETPMLAVRGCGVLFSIMSVNPSCVSCLTTSRPLILRRPLPSGSIITSRFLSIWAARTNPPFFHYPRQGERDSQGIQ